MKSRKSTNRDFQKKTVQEKHKDHISKSVSKVSTKRAVKKKNTNYALARIFPFQFNQAELQVDFTNEKRKFFSKGHSESFFEANYNSCPVTLSCVYESPIKCANDLRNTIFNYELKMSDRLSACRGINPYLASFKGCLNQQKTAFCIIKPSSDDLSLKDYIEKYESKYEQGREPIPLIVFLQMAISLFAMLRDAHLQKIGLVSLNTETIKVGIDQTLYFDDFKSCLELETKVKIKDKPWINFKKLPCPEWEKIETADYYASADVFSAAAVLAQLIKIPSDNNLPPFQRVPNQGIISIMQNRIREPFRDLSPVLDTCFDVDPNNRPTAEELLTLFEDLRAKALSSAF